MKVATKDDSAKADCIVKANGNAIQEFQVSADADEGVFSAWIPVEAGQKITVDVGCNVQTKDVYFDLLVDGILRNTILKSPKEWSNERKTAKLHSAHHMVDGKVTAVDLFVKDLAQTEEPESPVEGLPTIGDIEVRVWILQHEKQERHQQTAVHFESCSDWRNLKRDASALPSPVPTFEIDCVPTDYNPLPGATITNLRKRILAARPGDRPWVTFKFAYRTQADINAAAMMKAPSPTKKNMLRWTPDVPKLIAANDKDESEDTTESEKPKSATSVNGEAAGSTSPDLSPDLGSQDGSTQVATVTKATASSSTPTTTTPPSIKAPTKASDPDLFVPDDIFIKNETAEAETKINAINMPPKQRKSSRGKTAEPEPYQSSIAKRDELIKEYEASVAEFGDINEEAKDLLLVEHLKSKKTEKEADLEPEVEPEAEVEEPTTPKQEVPLATVVDPSAPPAGKPVATPVARMVTPKSSPAPSSTPATPGTPAIKLAAKNALKRKASMTPDGANKKLKSDNNAMDKEVAKLEKLLAEKKKARDETVRKFDEAELQRKEALERRMAELRAELEAVEEEMQEVQVDYEDTMSIIAASQREDSVLAE